MIVMPPQASAHWALPGSRSLLLVIIVFWHVVVLVSKVVPGTFQEAFVIVLFEGGGPVSGY